jgi:LPXTG-motif cell wall-anchored protein
MGFNNYTQAGNISSYNMYSTTPTATVADGVQGTPYTVGQLTGALGSTSFVIAIDVNTTGAAGETLLLFEVIINGAVAYDYIGPTDIGDVNNNGNGFADWTLGTVSLAGLAPGSTVLFHAVWNNASDGAESFFLVPTTTVTTPEASTMQLTLAGVALLGLGYFVRRRKTAANEL